jgi:hypothetical protein
VRRIVGHIEVECDATHLAAPTDVPVEHGLEQRLAHPQQFAARDVVLEPRQRRLRGERSAGDRVAPEHQLVHRVIDESRRVISVLVAQCQAVGALAEQVHERVSHLAALAPVDECVGESRDQTQATVGGLQQHRAAIRAGVGDVERGRQRAIEEIREQHTRCRARVTHSKTSVLGRRAPEQRLSTMRRSSCWLRFVNNPG